MHYELSGRRHIIRCSNCGAQADVGVTKALAVTAWNRRAADADVEALVEALRAMERCPGFYTTDQKTGETFHTLQSAALARFRSKENTP